MKVSNFVPFTISVGLTKLSCNCPLESKITILPLVKLDTLSNFDFNFEAIFSLDHNTLFICKLSASVTPFDLTCPLVSKVANVSGAAFGTTFILPEDIFETKEFDIFWLDQVL